MSYETVKIYPPLYSAAVSHRTETASGVFSPTVSLDDALVPRAAKLTFLPVVTGIGFGSLLIDIVFSASIQVQGVYVSGCSITSGLVFTLSNEDSGSTTLATRVQDGDSAVGATANELILISPISASHYRLTVTGIPLVDGNRSQIDIANIAILGAPWTPQEGYDWGFSHQDASQIELEFVSGQTNPNYTKQPRAHQYDFTDLNDADALALSRFQRSLNLGYCLVDANPASTTPETKVLGTLTLGRRVPTRLDRNNQSIFVTEKHQWI